MEPSQPPTGTNTSPENDADVTSSTGREEPTLGQQLLDKLNEFKKKKAENAGPSERAKNVVKIPLKTTLKNVYEMVAAETQSKENQVRLKENAQVLSKLAQDFDKLQKKNGSEFQKIQKEVDRLKEKLAVAEELNNGFPASQNGLRHLQDKLEEYQDAVTREVTSLTQEIAQWKTQNAQNFDKITQELDDCKQLLHTFEHSSGEMMENLKTTIGNIEQRLGSFEEKRKSTEEMVQTQANSRDALREGFLQNKKEHAEVLEQFSRKVDKNTVSFKEFEDWTTRSFRMFTSSFHGIQQQIAQLHEKLEAIDKEGSPRNKTGAPTPQSGSHDTVDQYNDANVCQRQKVKTSGDITGNFQTCARFGCQLNVDIGKAEANSKEPSSMCSAKRARFLYDSKATGIIQSGKGAGYLRQRRCVNACYLPT